MKNCIRLIELESQEYNWVVNWLYNNLFHLSKLWKAKFSILCDVIFLVRLQENFGIDHSWECMFEAEGPRVQFWHRQVASDRQTVRMHPRRPRGRSWSGRALRRAETTAEGEGAGRKGEKRAPGNKPGSEQFSRPLCSTTLLGRKIKRRKDLSPPPPPSFPLAPVSRPPYDLPLGLQGWSAWRVTNCLRCWTGYRRFIERLAYTMLSDSGKEEK